MGKKARKNKVAASSEPEAKSRRKPRQAEFEPVVDVAVDTASVGVWPPETGNEEVDAFALAALQEGGDIARLHLERRVLLPETIFEVPSILSPEECAAWIKWGETLGFAEAKQAASAYYAHRDNGRIAVESPDIAQRIFDRVRRVVPLEIDCRRAVGCSSNIRLYRYREGQRFGKHIDESNLEESSQAWSEFTLLFYLNDEGLEGGETVFYKGSTGAKECLRVAPRAGAALLHWHGDRCLLHEGAAVRHGVKYLLRTDVLYK